MRCCWVTAIDSCFRFFFRVISILPQCPEPERQLLLCSTVIHCKILQERQRPEFENLKEDTSYQEHLASFSHKSRCKPAKEQRSQVTLTCGLVIFSHSARRRSCRSCWFDSLSSFWMRWTSLNISEEAFSFFRYFPPFYEAWLVRVLVWSSMRRWHGYCMERGTTSTATIYTHLHATLTLFVPHITIWGSNFLLAIRRAPPTARRPPSSSSLYPLISITWICINLSVSTALYQLVSSSTCLVLSSTCPFLSLSSLLFLTCLSRVAGAALGDSL